MKATPRELVAEHWERLYRANYLVCRNASDAEDLTQEALTKALASIGQFDAARPLEPWLNRIASNGAKDWLRRLNKLEFVALDADPVDDADAIADQIADRSLPDDLSEALGRLDPLSRLVIVLRHLLDLNATEIASLLETEPATVRTRLRRGLLQLREELESEEVDHVNEAR